MNYYDLLAGCFDLDERSPNRDALREPNLNWEFLIRTAQQELVLPSVKSSLERSGMMSQLPSEVSDFFCGVEDLNGERNETIFRELMTVVELLNKCGIEPVLLKGAAYCATGVYTNPASRYLMDVDLLVPKQQLSSATVALSRCGFDWDRNDRLGCFRHHHPPLRRPGAVSFELHHSLGMGICSSLLPAPEVLERSVQVEFLGTRFRVPCSDHLMTHLVIHSQIHHPYNERIWPSLRSMYDLVLLQRRFGNEIDWTGIERRFREVGRLELLGLHLLQVRDVLGLEKPIPFYLSGLTYLRWTRRKLLRRMPLLRFLDPVYIYSTIFVRRLWVLRQAFGMPGGRAQIVRELFAPGVYKRLLTEAMQGPGR